MIHFDAIIFDMDGLLLDSEQLALMAFNETLEICGLGDETDLFHKTIGTNTKSCKKILREGLRGKFDSDKFGSLWYEKYSEKAIDSPIPLKDGALSLLKQIKNAALPTAIATSTETGIAKKKLEKSGLLDYFEVIVGGERVKNGKPEPDIYILAAKELNVDPKKCLGLEDSDNGVKSAVSAGLTVIQIPDIVEPSDTIKNLGHIILKSLNDVASYKFA